MKNQLSNPIKYNKIVIIEALFMTILLHALLFLCFCTKNVSDDLAGQNKPTITLLNMSVLPNEELQKFKQFLKFNDPSMFTSSVNPNGYGKLFHQRRVVAFENSKINNNLNMVKYVADYEHGKLPDQIKLQAADKAVKIDNLANIRHNSAESTNPIKYPLAIGNDGSQIKFVFSQDELQILEQQHNIGNTIIRVKQNQDGVLRLNIVQSSGQRNFDLLSYRLLYRAIQEAKNFKATFYTVYYREDQL